MDKWEYKLEKVSQIDLVNNGGVEPFLNDRGADGWELVVLKDTTTLGKTIWDFLFKRRIA